MGSKIIYDYETGCLYGIKIFVITEIVMGHRTELSFTDSEQKAKRIVHALRYHEIHSGIEKSVMPSVPIQPSGWICRHCSTRHNDEPSRCTYCGTKPSTKPEGETQ